MLIQKIAVHELNPAPYNPRIALRPGDPAWIKLERSLTEFNLVQPIVWNRRTGHVVSGHQRLAVLKHQGQTEVDCVIVDLPLEKEKALNVTLNNSHVGSEWDADKLIDLVSELQDLPDFDATLTGFDEQQLKDLILTPELPEEICERSPETDRDIIRITLEIRSEDWDDIQKHLDDILASYPATRLHGAP